MRYRWGVGEVFAWHAHRPCFCLLLKKAELPLTQVLDTEDEKRTDTLEKVGSIKMPVLLLLLAVLGKSLHTLDFILGFI